MSLRSDTEDYTAMERALRWLGVPADVVDMIF